jgi:hypothetical protein
VIEVFGNTDHAGDVIDVAHTHAVARRACQQLARKHPERLYCYILVLVDDGATEPKEVSHE